MASMKTALCLVGLVMQLVPIHGLGCGEGTHIDVEADLCVPDTAAPMPRVARDAHAHADGGGQSGGQFGGIYIDEATNQLRIDAPDGAATYIDGMDVVAAIQALVERADDTKREDELAASLRAEMVSANKALQNELVELRNQLAEAVADLYSTTTTTTATGTSTTTTYVAGTCNGVAEPARCGDLLKPQQCADDASVQHACPAMCGTCTTTTPTSTSVTTSTTTATTTTATTTTATTIPTTTIPPHEMYCFKGIAGGMEHNREMCMVKMKKAVRLDDIQIYHRTCRSAGKDLSAYNSDGNNGSCKPVGGFPIITKHCNMGGIWSQFLATEAFPHMPRAVWIAITTSGSPPFGIEWNEAGPCDRDTNAQMCGRNSGGYRGLQHSLNPRYSSNYNVKNYRIEAGHFLACYRDN